MYAKRERENRSIEGFGNGLQTILDTFIGHDAFGVKRNKNVF